MLSACATRPVTEGVTGINSYFIAQAIRCEMRDEVISLIADYVEQERPTEAAVLRFRDTRDAAEDAEARRFEEFLTRGYRALAHDELREAVELYKGIQLGYAFDFNITLENNIGGGLDLLGTFTGGKITTGLTASWNGKRNTVRAFTLLDTVEGLLTQRPTIRVCNELRRPPHQPRTANLAYPIAGTLELREIFETFISLNQSANLTDSDPKSPNIPTLTETMNFTTTLVAGVKPALEISPLRNKGLEVKGGNLDLKAGRTDVHKLVLTLNLPAKGFALTAETRNQQEAAAIDEIQRQRDRELQSDATRLRLLLGL